ncbi:hypothetical protein AA0242T_2186 [Acetobacter aceti NRIC 0242]|uniref:Transposase n=1 Tax=Acetobacter aceti NBRC 14818 TaxID=887700 RepID=A0AB33IGV1_ACEAC|nr:IS1 family transposase [Acetobacter aceti]TCS29653.1 hypothetical protein EDC15_12038 [Acetobacter aceti NBRC 14818]BCK77152.1 transposase [Acetobacter aceti NBRC 14818]GAN57839.1 transposase [Acetobacter aceti NBRC 14818]GBO81484.1 hypothetical protein AA0242T_2186 [Acetobacter aceti NRIC 0242]
MNKLTIKERSRILHLLCEGISIRAITQLTGASKNTVAKLLIDAGRICAAYHDTSVRNVKAACVQVDEIWSFTYAKQKNVAVAKGTPEGAGDTWTWIAIDADSKMILSYLVGGRDAEYAMWFMDDLAARVSNSIQLTINGQSAYLEAAEDAFCADMDYVQLMKLYGSVDGNSTDKCYSPPECNGIRKRAIAGKSDAAYVSASYVERQNLAMRMHMHQFTRLTNTFSKRVENHAHAVALHMMYYNFVRIHKVSSITPAMAAGVADRLWEIEDIAMLIEQAEAAPRKHDPYKKREILN